MLREKVEDCLSKIKRSKINAFLEINKNAIKEADAIEEKKKKGRLYGFIIGVKSNINVLGMTASCASKTLENYKSTYDASVIEKIRAEDGLIIGMTNCDEFASGTSGENSAFGATENPAVKGHVAGGSSSGSVAAVAAGLCDMALGSDTGGSIRVPASFCGIVGVKPSYGLVSRHGLIDLSMSLDQIGPIARNVEDAALLLDVIKGLDERDTSTLTSGKIEFKIPSKVNIGIVDIKGIDKKIKALIDGAMGKVKSKLNWSEKKVDIKHIDLAIETYHPIVWTEFYSATRRFDGRKYGRKIEDSAGQEALRRIFGGSEIAKAESAGRYYHRALQAKEVIKREFEGVFEDVDCLIMPTSPVLPWKIGEKKSLEELYAVDALVIPANLAEACAISIPAGKIDGKPVGLQVICAKGEESKMLSIASEILKNINN